MARNCQKTCDKKCQQKGNGGNSAPAPKPPGPAKSEYDIRMFLIVLGI